VSEAFPIAGDVDSRFDLVRDTFVENFSSGDELGASFAVCIDGQLSADLYGGFVDRKKESPWSQNTLACIYSSGKAVLSLLIAREVSNGVLDYEKPVAAYWPEFAAAGKQTITVAEALSHQAGLCGFPEEMAPAEWLEWDLICSRIAEMAPLWMPGSASGYHPQTFGFIAGELLRLVTGTTVGEILRKDYPDLRIYCGIDFEKATRTAYMPKPPRAPDLGELNEFTQIAFLKKWSAPSGVAREEWMAAEIPASNMHAQAASLARFVYPFANDGRNMQEAPVLNGAALEGFFRERISGPDLVLPFTLSWCAGMMRNINRQFGPSETAYGHAGFGGSCVVFDPQHRISMAYVMNKMSPHLVGDPRAKRLIEAVYDCL